MSEADTMFLRWIIGFSILFVLRDWYIITIKKRVPDHGRGLTMRIFISTSIALVTSDGAQAIVENLICGFFIVGFIFMYGLNIVRGKGLLYLNPESNKTDGILLKIFRVPLAVFFFAFLGFLLTITVKVWGLQCLLHGCY